MAELTLIDERIISGRGVLKVPDEAKTSRYWIMYVDVIRRPKNEYLELNWNPNQSLYARMVYLRNNYAQQYDYIKFQREQRLYINDITGQNLRAIKCAYEGILQTFFNLGNALLLPSISIENKIKDYKSLALSWDEIRFSCYSNTALQVRFYGLQYDVCNTENDDSDNPPPPPPPKPPVDTNQPVEVSDPYDDNNDDGNTEPFTGDTFPEPPPPEPNSCDRCLVTVRGIFNNGDSRTFVGIKNEPGGYQYAPIVQAVVNSQPGNSYVSVIGGYALGTFACDGSNNREVRYSEVSFNPNFFYVSAEILSIEVIP